MRPPRHGSKKPSDCRVARQSGNEAIRRAWLAGKSVVVWTVTTVLLGAGAIAGALLYVARSPRMPALDALAEYHALSSTRVLDREGLVIGEIGAARHTPVPLRKMAPDLVRAAVADDPRFLEGSGLHLTGVVRAVAAVVGLGMGGDRRGPVALDVARRAFPLAPRDLRRRFEEAAFAARLTAALPRDKIVELRLNYGDYGERRYGCEEAAKHLFGKRAADVDLAEATLLVSLLDDAGATRIDPRKHTQAAKALQCRVLRRMAAGGLLDEARAHDVCIAPIGFGRPARGHVALAPEVIDWVTDALAQEHGRARLDTLGLAVPTTIDFELQTAAAEIVTETLTAFDAKHAIAASSLRRGGAPSPLALERGEITAAVVERVEVDPRNSAPGRVFVDVGGRPGVVDLAWEERWTGGAKPFAATLRRGDVVPVRAAPERLAVGEGDAPVEAPVAFDLGPQAALVAMNPRTREIVTLFGGLGNVPGRPDRTSRGRAPAGLLSPFVHTAALETKRHTALALRPPFVAGDIAFTARLARALGPAIVRDLAMRVGILKPEGPVAEVAALVSPLEVANAFATLAAGGHVGVPRVRPAGPRTGVAADVSVVSPDAAFITSSFLEGVAKDGHARAIGARFPGEPYGAFSATGEHDAWFVALTSELVVVVWVGFDDDRTLPARGDANPAAEIALGWLGKDRDATARPPAPFARPRTLVSAHVDPKTGNAVPPEIPGIDEVFLQGTQPRLVWDYDVKTLPPQAPRADP